MTGGARPRMQLRDPEGDRRRRLRQLAEPGTCVAPTPPGAARWGESSLLDARTAALVGLATLAALRAGPASYRRGVADALAAGASVDDVVATLEVVAGTVGLARVVAAAPDLARAAGYDLDRALEDRDEPPAGEAPDGATPPSGTGG